MTENRTKMSTVTRTIIILLLAALALSACGKHSHTPDDSEQPALIGFAPLSQDEMTKGEANFPHIDFGVWGIARQSGFEDYILWNPTAASPKMERVYLTEFGYIPENDAYWLGDYTYNFLAVAPYVGSADVITSISAGNASGKESLSFTFDMGEKYDPTTAEYDFDLMAAVAQNSVTGPAATHPSVQPLKFWHLLSQINLFVSFDSDLAGNPISGTLTGVRLCDLYTSARYTISSSPVPGEDPDEVELVVDYTAISTSKDDMEYSVPSPVAPDGTDPDEKPQFTFHIIPQSVKSLPLYIDFAINEGTEDEPKMVYYEDLKINLNIPANADPYVNNGKYNWRIKIGTGTAIKFEVEVVDWVSDPLQPKDPIVM